MFQLNAVPDYRQPLAGSDVMMLGREAVAEVERFLAFRDNHAPTPLRSLDGMAAQLGLGAIHIKDESYRLGLKSFKALGGAYAVMKLLLEDASQQLGRAVDITELKAPEIAAIAGRMTVACATDGNHGRSVAQGAALVGARAVVFVHGGVSAERAAAIAGFGAEIVRVIGNYDDSVAEAARVAAENGWTVLSDTSWPGYERIPGLVMQGYTALVREALREMPAPPTHVFVQAGVGGIAAAVAGYLAIEFGDNRPVLIVVEPARAACIFESARAGYAVKIAHGEATVMAMLECYEPSLVAWRILARLADAFMTVDEEDAIGVMKRLAYPAPGDPAIVSGESGGVGLAGLIKAVNDPATKAALRLDGQSRVLLINTEGATDPEKYAELVGASPDDIDRGNA